MTSLPPIPGGAFGGSTAAVLSLPSLTLSDDESRTMQWLTMRLFDQRPYLLLRGLYYDGLQKMQDLGISIPPSLSGLRTVMGWPQIAVDSLDERAVVEGFRYPDDVDTDEDLWDIWQSNNLDGESSLAQLDALIYGRCYITVGPGDDTTNGQPLITAESPINMTATWDARLRRPTAALQLYLDSDFTSDMYGQEVAALYLPDRTVYMARTASAGSAATGTGQWEITDRDTHNLGRLPVVRMANRQRLSNRDGLSEISPAMMNTTDSACRTMLGMEVGREFHAAPRRAVLGAAEDAFKNADGTPKSGWDTYMNKIWGLERDEEGNVPSIFEFKTGDPKAYTVMIDTYTEVMAGLAAVPAEYLGKTSNGNPTSADAIRAQEARLVKRVQRKMVAFGEAWEDTLRLALLVRGGELPDQAHRIETDWIDPNTPTVAATSQAITGQVAAGMLPAGSDVGLKKVGYTAVERERIKIERAADPGDSMIEEIGHSDIVKAATATARIEKLLNNPGVLVGDPNAAPAAPKPGPAIAPPPKK